MISFRKNNMQLNYDEYDIFKDEVKIGKIKINSTKHIIFIHNFFIKKEFRNKKYGEEVIKKICKENPSKVITGNVIYIKPISFWGKFDKDLKNIKTKKDKNDFVTNYGIFAFETNSVI